MNQASEARYSKEIVTKVDSMLRNCPLDMIYFNVIFTESEIILDFVNRSFRTWLLRIKPYKSLKYEGMEISKIKNRHEENIVIQYKDIKKVKLIDRTIFKNTSIEIIAKGFDGRIRLFSRNKVYLENNYNLLKEVLFDKVEFV